MGFERSGSVLSTGPEPTSGHRLLPHVADVVLEAWGSSRCACLEAAVRGLVDAFADVGGCPVTDSVARSFDDGDDADLLVRTLEEVIWVVEVLGKVPVDVRLREDAGGTVSGFFETVGVDAVEATGALPKGVSRSDLVFVEVDGRWRCHVLIDV